MTVAHRGARARRRCRSSARRRSPSVKTPSTRLAARRRPRSCPRPLRRHLEQPGAERRVRADARQRRRRVRMTSSTCSSSRRPRLPPGCERAKSSAVKPRASSSATASASPIASVAVVLAVGARLSGQASSATLTSSATVAARAERRVAVAGQGDQRHAEALQERAAGAPAPAVSPEFDSASTTSARGDHAEVAVAGLGGVQEERRACRCWRGSRRSCRPTCPDLPMPVTTTRPLAVEAQAAGRANAAPSRGARRRDGPLLDGQGTARGRDQRVIVGARAVGRLYRQDALSCEAL